MKFQIDNHEMKLNYFELVLHRPNLERLPVYELPEGYRFCFYEVEQDREAWLEIETSAKEFLTVSEGRESWEEYYGEVTDGEADAERPASKAARGKELPTVREELLRRMLFVVSPSGEKVATATAFYEPEDESGAGWLHWVAVRRDYQGKGLAKPLIYKALSVMKELGYREAKVPTQTTTWLAVKLYLDFGFLPLPENAVSSRKGYRIMRTLTGHPALSGFPPLPESELFDPVAMDIEYQLKERFSDLAGYMVRQKDGKNRIWYLLRDEFEARCVSFTVDEKGKVWIRMPKKTCILVSEFPEGFPKEFADAVKSRLTGVLHSLAFVASDFHGSPEKTDDYLERFLNMFEAAGIHFGERAVVDGRMTAEQAKECIRSADVVWLAGGDTLLQRKNIREYGLEEPLRERDGITIGMSAGAINMAERVVRAKEEPNGVPELSVYEGIGLTDFNVEPHLNLSDEAQLAKIREAAETTPIYGLYDGSFIIVEQGKREFFGDYVLFS